MKESTVTTDREPIRTKPEAPRPSAGRRFAHLLVRFLIAVILGIALGAGAYFGVPALYRHYIQPVSLNSQRIAELDQTLAQSRLEERQGQEQISQRLTAVEGQLASQAEALSALQAEFRRLRTTADRQAGQLEDLSDLGARVDSLRQDLEATEADVAELGGEGSAFVRLERQVHLIRVMELITRARLWLTQSNLGLAEEEVRAARDILRRVAEAAPEGQAAELQAILVRLDLALDDLRTAPVVAADDLDVAWRLLILSTDS
jgi:uncharacterized coiled-coil protein SlyX